MNERVGIVEIDLSPIATPSDLQTLLAESLGFPDFYGHNWNAFWDAITGLVSMPHRLRFVGWHYFAKRLPQEAQQLQDCLRDALSRYPDWSSSIEYA